MKFEETGDLGLKLSKKSLLLWLKEPPVPSTLQQVVDQRHVTWRFRGRHPRDDNRKCFEANKKQLVEVVLKIGKGHAALELFSMAIGIHAMDKKTFSKCLHILYHPVSYDGTWQKRGHSSLCGIGIVIDILTELIIDYEILSKYCPECTTAKRDLGENSDGTNGTHTWYKSHQEECSEKYVGSSNAMEIKAAEILWNRSIKNCSMRYVRILSDGVMPRPINLKENTIVKLNNFYRKAIKDNVPDVRKMKGAILASLFHCSSTDKTPKHSKCPTGSTSWCFYQRALAKNENPMSHSLMKTKLSKQVLKKILPVYQRLANDELLERSSAGKTQNVNESIHSVIWKNFCF
ncbi:uncharacterized protein TNCV_3541661 [Trichonephila clavipes]|nr:uncharacterized protein TNCV_3541661 [Trichonephila clavipes]